MTPPVAFFPVAAVAIVLTLNVWRGGRTGYVAIGIGGAKRVDDPAIFWFGMVLSATGAAFMATIAVILFWRPA